MRVFADDADARGQEFPASVICGPQSAYFVLDTSQPGAAVGVNLRPGAAASVLGIPADQLSDRHVGLEDIWGGAARKLRDRLREARSPERRFAILEQALAARLQRPLLPHPAVAYALRAVDASPSLARVGQVRDETGYSAKRFIELFRHSVGLAPKRYCRIRRFQTVIESLARGEPVEWAGVAADSGYSDQSHLNREFRALAGVTPGEYRPVSNDRPSHVAIGP